MFWLGGFWQGGWRSWSPTRSSPSSTLCMGSLQCPRCPSAGPSAHRGFQLSLSPAAFPSPRSFPLSSTGASLPFFSLLLCNALMISTTLLSLQPAVPISLPYVATEASSYSCPVFQKQKHRSRHSEPGRAHFPEASELNLNKEGQLLTQRAAGPQCCRWERQDLAAQITQPTAVSLPPVQPSCIEPGQQSRSLALILCISAGWLG